MATGRNDPCPCGSGKKFKHCHEGKKSISKGMIALLAGIAAVAAVGIIASITDRTPAGTSPAPAAAANPNPMSPGKPQPPGPVPAGKVWSVEHGHWHDINPAAGAQPGAQPPGGRQTIQIGNPPAGTAKAPVPQPPGPVPAGKVWSPEHGHWHDAPR